MRAIMSGMILSNFFVLSFQVCDAQQTLVVHPPWFADAEGSGSGATNIAPSRFQQVHLGELFPELPEANRWISAFSWRPDGSLTGPVSHFVSEFEVRLSTTSVDPDELSWTFSENIGEDQTLVYEGPITFSTENTGPVNGPKDFDVTVEFQTPFYYDSTRGNLLLELINPVGLRLPMNDICCTAENPASIGWVARTGNYQSPIADQGGLGGGIQFTFGPGPLAGDFNRDRVLDAIDIDALSQKVRDGSTELLYDLNNNGTVEDADRAVWVKDLKNTYFGDADLNGEFNSTDFAKVFLAGEYEDPINDNSGWAEGDWDGDGDFTSGDFVTAFLDGGYEQGPRPAAAVPEPAAMWLLLAGGLLLVRRIRLW